MFGKESPIGIIDSGIGGFSVTRRVQELLPQENLIYLGDGANTPYGNHSQEEILSMTRYMLRFMEQKGVKALLVACNTISCLLPHYENEMSCPIFSVVKAGAEAASAGRGNPIGVISTCFTAESGCYPQMIGALNPNKRVISHGCPNLAGLIEHHLGEADGIPLIDADLTRELSPLIHEEGITACVLGCTHYPLVQDRIHALYPELTLLDPAQQMAGMLKQYLVESNLNQNSGMLGYLDIYTTGDTREYIEKSSRAGLSLISSIKHHPPMGCHLARQTMDMI